MAKTRARRISEFIKKVKAETGLSLKGIEKASYNPVTGEKISGNYVNDLVKEDADLTIGKAQSLARGLGVSEDLFFEIARGVDEHSTGVHRCSSTCLAKQISELPAEDQKQLRPLLDMVQKEVATLRRVRQQKKPR